MMLQQEGFEADFLPTQGFFLRELFAQSIS